MPKLANPRHETFAWELAHVESQTSAYVRAGYKGGNAHASRLAAHSAIIERVRELLAGRRGYLARRARATPQSLYESYLRLASTVAAIGDAKGAEQARLALMAAEQLLQNGLQDAPKAGPK